MSFERADQSSIPGLMSPAATALCVVDLQEKLFPAIAQSGALMARCQLLIKAALLHGIPILVSEQYPRGLGRTIPEIARLLRDPPTDSPVAIPPTCCEKISFSAAGEPVILQRLNEWKTRAVLVIGIETHVCVMQTALALRGEGFEVFVAADAVGSRHPSDMQWGLHRMAAAGVIITTAEAAVFEWTRTAAVPIFKALSQLIKDSDVQRHKE